MADEEARFGGVGWAQPHGSQRYHAFQPEGRSLCNKWLFFGPLDTKAIGEPSDVDCAACRRKVTTLIRRVNAAANAAADVQAQPRTKQDVGSE